MQRPVRADRRDEGIGNEEFEKIVPPLTKNCREECCLALGMGPDEKFNAGGESPGEQRLDTKTREAGVGFYDRAKWQARNLSAVGRLTLLTCGSPPASALI